MIDVNLMIANNIHEILRGQGKKLVDLAAGIGVSEQIVSKMLNGGRSINALELKRIADYLGVSVDSMMQMPATMEAADVIPTFMGRVETQEAKRALEIAGEVSDRILFHRQVRQNGVEMMKPLGV